MAIIYTVIFLTLFSLFSSTLQKNYLHIMNIKPYSHFIFPKYVHHPRPHKISGLDLKDLVINQKNSKTTQEFFINVIEHAYKGTEVWSEHLAEDLLKLFQSQIVFDQTQAKDDEFHHVKKLSDLDSITPSEPLAEIYSKLMNGSEFNEDTSAGYPSLKMFLSIPNSSVKSKINLIAAHPKLIEVMYGKSIAEEMARFKLENLESYKLNDKPLIEIWDTLCRTNHISTDLKDLAMLRYAQEEDPFSDQ